MAAALQEVAAGSIPRDRLALKCLYEDMAAWPYLTGRCCSAEGRGFAEPLRSYMQPCNLQPMALEVVALAALLADAPGGCAWGCAWRMPHCLCSHPPDSPDADTATAAAKAEGGSGAKAGYASLESGGAAQQGALLRRPLPAAPATVRPAACGSRPQCPGTGNFSAPYALTPRPRPHSSPPLADSIVKPYILGREARAGDRPQSLADLMPDWVGYGALYGISVIPVMLAVGAVLVLFYNSLR
jgi:hypothetical protein